MAISINEILVTAAEAPCSSELIEIIKNEMKNGNIVTAFDKVVWLSETYYILLFRDMPKENYPCVKKCHKKNGAEYISVVLTDSDGCTEIRFNY